MTEYWMEATGGFEPPNRGFADLRLSHLATSPYKSRHIREGLLERETRLELATSSLGGRRSTTELLPLISAWCRGRDSNSHRLSPTTPSRWRVYQFHHLGFFKWQGWQDSNPRPAVLETAALPTELHPCGEEIIHEKGFYVQNRRNFANQFCWQDCRFSFPADRHNQGIL